MGDVRVEIERKSRHDGSAQDLAREIKSRLLARLGLSCEVVCHEEGVLPRYEAKATRVQFIGG